MCFEQFEEQDDVVLGMDVETAMRLANLLSTIEFDCEGCQEFLEEFLDALDEGIECFECGECH